MEDSSITDEKIYRKHRDDIQENIKASWKAFDKMLLTLTGGSLAISFAFIKDIIKVDPTTKVRMPAEMIVFLWLGWFMLVACLTLNLLSHYWSALAGECAQEKIDAGYKDLKASRSRFAELAAGWDKKVRTANFICCVLLIFGIASLLVFAIQNL